MSDAHDEEQRSWFARSCPARPEGIVNHGDQWVVTGFIPYEGMVMLAKFRSREYAILALFEAARHTPGHATRVGPHPNRG